MPPEPRRRARVTIRPLTPGADPAVAAVFTQMSPHSRYLRFHGPVAELTPRLEAALLDVDGRHRVALVAEVRSGRTLQPVGIARLAAIAPGRAELAVAVADAWHGRGVGRRLLEALRGQAEALGYHELVAEVLPENEPVRRLLARVFPGSRVARGDGHALTVRCPVGAAATALTVDDILADLAA